MVREPNLGSVQYRPGQVPTDPSRLENYLREEFDKMAAAISALALGHIDPTTVAPKKPRRGDFRYADGVMWNPGSGEGAYLFNGTIWKFWG